MRLSREANEARKAYFRKWREQNKARTKEYQRRYWEKKAKAEAEKSR